MTAYFSMYGCIEIIVNSPRVGTEATSLFLNLTNSAAENNFYIPNPFKIMAKNIIDERFLKHILTFTFSSLFGNEGIIFSCCRYLDHKSNAFMGGSVFVRCKGNFHMGHWECSVAWPVNFHYFKHFCYINSGTYTKIFPYATDQWK